MCSVSAMLVADMCRRMTLRKYTELYKCAAVQVHRYLRYLAYCATTRRVLKTNRPWSAGIEFGCGSPQARARSKCCLRG